LQIESQGWQATGIMKMEPDINFVGSVIGKDYLANFPALIADTDVWSLRSFEAITTILQLQVQETEASYSGQCCAPSYYIQLLRSHKVRALYSVLASLLFFVVSMRLNNRGTENGRSDVAVIRWTLAVVGGAEAFFGFMGFMTAI
jgi:hypothetical protein